jgi:beta-glucanase (GH16 family)
MKRLVLFIIFQWLGLVILNSQVLLKLQDDSLITYRFNNGDEFNTQNLDEGKWTNGLPWSRVIMSQDLAFIHQNVRQQDGLANFLALKKDSDYILKSWEIDSAYLKKKKLTLKENKFLVKYTAGCIVSKEKYHYGLYELRFKVEQGKGVWPAFWFYGGNKNEEIDGFELKCERNNEIHVDTHCPYGCDKGYKNKFGLNTNWGGWLPISNYLHNGFNVMMLEWEPNGLTWYINGYPLAYFNGNFSNPMNLYLNTSVAKDGGAFKPGPDQSTKWPNNYYVDYFRNWKKISQNEEIILTKNNEFIVSQKFPPTKNLEPLKKRGLLYNKKKLCKMSGYISLSISSSNKLIINTLGKINNRKISFQIKGLTTGKIVDVTSSEIEKIIEIDSRDKEIQFIVNVNKKEFSKIVKLQ